MPKISSRILKVPPSQVNGEESHPVKEKIASAIKSLAVPIDSLVPDPRNARLHSDENIAAIRASLEMFGQVKPIVVRDQTRMVMAGNGTLKAARLLGWTEIAASFVQMTETEAISYGLADNRTAELARWDLEAVKSLTMILDVAGTKSGNIGWTDDQIQDILKGEWRPPEVDGGQNIWTFTSGEQEYYTPGIYIEAARKVLGTIDLDPASCETAQRAVKASRYYTKEDDGLSKDWSGRVWMNPPYTGSIVDKFVLKLCSHFESGDVLEAVVLVNNATETQWFRRIAELCSLICFPTGRINFDTPDQRNGKGSNLYGQAFFYLGKKGPRFAKEFARFGLILQKFPPAMKES